MNAKTSKDIPSGLSLLVIVFDEDGRANTHIFSNRLERDSFVRKLYSSAKRFVSGQFVRSEIKVSLKISDSESPTEEGVLSEERCISDVRKSKHWREVCESEVDTKDLPKASNRKNRNI